MQTDVNLIFTGSNTGAAQAITSAAVTSTGVLDLATGLMLTGTTYAAATALSLSYGNATIFGEDLALGSHRIPMSIVIGAAFVGGTSLNIAIQGAIDAGGTAISGLTFNTYGESGAQPVAVLGTANTFFPMVDWPQRALAALGTDSLLPRFLRLQYTPVGTFSAGTIAFAGFVAQRPDLSVGYYPSGFKVGP